MRLQLLEWIAFVGVFFLGFVLGSYLQHRQDRKYIKQIEDAMRDAALRRALRFPTAFYDLLQRERRPDFNIAKGFDDDT